MKVRVTIAALVLDDEHTYLEGVELELPADEAKVLLARGDVEKVEKVKRCARIPGGG